jgi:hypothetical protein
MIGDLSPHDFPHDVELGLEPPDPDCWYCDDRGCSECDPEPDPEADPEVVRRSATVPADGIAAARQWEAAQEPPGAVHD